MEINGKRYPLWSQFVEQKNKWIGGTIEDLGDSFDHKMGFENAKGKITDIILRPNGKESAYFEVCSEGWGCGFDVGVGGISGDPKNEKGWIAFHGYGGHKWRIKQQLDC